MKVVLATRNRGKIKEFRELLAGSELQLVGLDEFPQIKEIEETGTTFRENAVLKAKKVARLTGLPAVADDSGLLVDALAGAPGVNSARYAGIHGDDQANNEKLLKSMIQVPGEQRTARFCCVIAVATPAGETSLVEGICTGTIAREARGERGFGYDPLFIPTGSEITMGQMPEAEKNKISHRGKAAAQAVQVILELVRKKG